MTRRKYVKKKICWTVCVTYKGLQDQRLEKVIDKEFNMCSTLDYDFQEQVRPGVGNMRLRSRNRFIGKNKIILLFSKIKLC